MLRLSENFLIKKNQTNLDAIQLKSANINFIELQNDFFSIPINNNLNYIDLYSLILNNRKDHGSRIAKLTSYKSDDYNHYYVLSLEKFDGSSYTVDSNAHDLFLDAFKIQFDVEFQNYSFV